MTLPPHPTRRPRLLFGSLRPYQGAWLRPDLVASATVWAVLVPESFAYATIAQTRPVVLDGQTSPFIDITAASMLEELAATLARRGITLAAAGSIGTVRDVVRAASAEGALALSPGVDDAIAAHKHGS